MTADDFYRKIAHSSLLKRCVRNSLLRDRITLNLIEFHSARTDPRFDQWHSRIKSQLIEQQVRFTVLFGNSESLLLGFECESDVVIYKLLLVI